MQFRDRTAAGQLLAQEIRDAGIEADLVLAIPRGGLPVGRAVADARTGGVAARSAQDLPVRPGAEGLIARPATART